MGIFGVSAVAAFNADHPSGGELLIFSGPIGIVTDMDGGFVSSFDARSALGMPFVDAVGLVTTGPRTGSFVALDRDASTIQFFRLQ